MSAVTAVGGASPPRAGSLERWLARALPLAAFALYPLLLAHGWRRWNDPLVDFGRELYVPWRLAEGDVLYRDVAYFNGPLSPYSNALWFELFGTGLSTLLVVDAVLTALVAALLYLVLRRVGGPIGAGFGLLLFLPVFACGHFVGIGNYNFLSPYSHELVHGLLLGLAALHAAIGWRPGMRSRRLEVAGALLGLVFLTKPEIFAAAVAGVGATVVGALVVARKSPRECLPPLARLALPAAIAPLLACGLLAFAMPFGGALAAILGGWKGVLGGDVAGLPFYRHALGIDRPLANGRLALVSFGLVLAVLAPALLGEALLRGRSRATGVAAGAVALALVWLALSAQAPDLGGLAGPRRVGLAMRASLPYWTGFSRHLPITCLLTAIAAAGCACRARDPDVRLRWVRRAGCSVFATVLLAKIALNATFAHYGFALAMPGAMLVVLVGLEWLPQSLVARRCPGLVVRGATIGVLVAGGWFSWQVSELSFAWKTLPVAHGADRFYAAPNRGRGVEEALAAIEARFGPEDSVLVVPEGIMLNYLSRRRTPTRHINFMPPELLLFGEDEILAELMASPPAGVILVHKDTSEYGASLFGRDYGRSIMRWVRDRYRGSTLIFGEPPLEPGTRFGIELLE